MARAGLNRLAACCTVALLALAGGSPAAGSPYDAQCCADLERRIADLEEQAARRGNKTVSVTVTGLVNNAILAWDDGAESNAYVVTNDNQRSRFSFVGRASITPQLEAGYALDIGLRAANSKLVTQLNDGDLIAPGFNLRSSVWYLRHKQYGAIFVGSTFAASDRIANSNVTQTSAFDQYSAPENAGLGMFLRSSDNGLMTHSLLNWRRIIGAGGDQPGESQRGFNQIKYVSPTWNGLTFASDWVFTDFWDVALRYREQIAGFDVAAGIGYLQLTPNSHTRSVCPSTFITNIADSTACQQLRGSISIKHMDTGLFANIGANHTFDGIAAKTNRYANSGINSGQSFLAAQAGIERQLTPLGNTTLYGSYYTFDGGAASVLPVGPGDPLNPTGTGTWGVWHSSVEMWGGGLAQGIDDADMILYLTYRHVSGDLTLRELQAGAATGAIARSPIDSLQLFLSGAVIKF